MAVRTYDPNDELKKYRRALAAGKSPFPSTGKVTVGGVSASATTAADEQKELKGAADSVEAKIVAAQRAGRMTPLESAEALADVERITVQGKKQESTRSLFGKLRDTAIKQVIGPFAYGGDVLKGLAAIARTGQSVYKEAVVDPAVRRAQRGGVYAGIMNSLELINPVTSLGAAYAKLTDDKPTTQRLKELGETSETSLGDLINQAKDPDWGWRKTAYSQAVKEKVDKIQNPILRKAARTGHWTLDLGIEIQSDPISYVTGIGEVKYIGKAGKLLLVEKFGTTEMLTKYPVLAGRLNDIGRFGMYAIPMDILRAEGISTGVRVAGTVVPKTDELGYAIARPLSALRAKIGDIAAETRLVGPALRAFGPASRAGVARDIGRRIGPRYVIPESQVRETIANWSARQIAKGTVSAEYRLAAGGIQELANEIREKGLGERVISLAEARTTRPHIWSSATDDERRLTESFLEWQNNLYRTVQERYKSFGVDFNSEVRDFNWLEDYVHHVVTPEAKAWLKSLTTDELAKRGFKVADLNYDELLNVRAPLRFRKLRRPVTAPDGTVQYETFMGQRIEEGTIEEINKIFRQQSGTDINFFSPDFGAIADSYAYSMAKTMGREAYARRLMAFGDDAARLLTEFAIPDAELAAATRKVYEGLVQVRDAALGDARRAGEAFVDRAKRVIREAEDVVGGKQRALKTTRINIVMARRRLAKIEGELVAARAYAAQKTAPMRENFDILNKALLDEIRELRSVLDSGRTEEYAILKELQDAYLAVFPNAKRIPKNADEIIDKILAAKGVPSSREAREVGKRLAEVRKALDELPSSAEFAARREELVSQEASLANLERGFTALADARAAADYAPDGLLYGTAEDLMPLADDVIQGTPYRYMRTNQGNLADVPDAVATRAVPTSDLLDTRTTDGFRRVFGSDDTAQAVRAALQQAGLNGDVFADGYIAFKATGELSEQFAQQYPAEADLIRLIDGLGGVDVGGSGDNALVMHAVDQFRDILEGIAYSQGRTDVTGLALFDDVMGATIFGSERTGIVMPSRMLDDAADEDALSVLLDPRWSAPMPAGVAAPDDVSHALGGSELLQKLVEGDFESASLAATTLRDQLERELYDLGAEEVAREATAAQMRSLQGKAAGMARGAKRRVTKAQDARQALLKARGAVEVTLNGKKVVLTRDKVAKELEKKVSREARLRANMEATIAGEEKGIVGALERRQTRLGHILQSLFNQLDTLKSWNETSLQVYQREIQNMGAALATMPARGDAGVIARAWVARTQRTINSLATVADERTREALTRLLVMSDAAEVGLITANEDVKVARPFLDAVEAGNWMPKIVRAADEGWAAIEGLGIQVPEEVAGLWKPNLQKMAEAFAKKDKGWLKAVDAVGRFFKIYATGTVGFVARNFYSALFMNGVAGVSPLIMRESAEAMIRAGRNPVRWLDEIADPTLKAEYEQAWKAALASSRGFFNEIAEPIFAGSRAEKAILSNPFTRLIANGNEHVERMVRFQMALDTIRKQGNTPAAFTEAVQRIARYHFDYSDLSRVDAALLRFVPFWIWMSRNIPNQIANQWMRPSAYATYEKIQDSLPLDDKTVLPAWMSEYGPMGIGKFLGQDLILRPDMPQYRLDRAVDQMTRLDRIVGSMYPMYKVPVEWMAGRQLGIDTKPFQNEGELYFMEARGIDAALAQIARLSPYFQNEVFKDPDTGKWMISERLSYALGQFVPPVAIGQRLSGGALGGKSSLSDRQWGAIASFFGIPVEAITDKAKRGEFIRRQIALKDFTKELRRLGGLPEKGEAGYDTQKAPKSDVKPPYELPKTP